MCGIAGYFGTKTLEQKKLTLCIQKMLRRGPDSQAVRHWVNRAGRNMYLLHSRLSIIDLDQRANQPFHFAQKWLAFNGEMYNYREVRSWLESKGHTFQTTSDTEVFLQALDQGTEDAHKRSEGMWAMAMYDDAKGTFLLSRDRFGEKPLYVYRTPDGIYFGSEVKFIQALLDDRLKVNREMIYRFMINGYKSIYKTKDTFFDGIEELPSASYLQFSEKGEEVQVRYWTPSFQQDQQMTEQEAIDQIRQKLIHSVEIRLRADVPLAFCMSGGVDSNALIGIAKNVFNYDVHGFTIINRDPRYEENEIVQASVKELGIRHTAIPVQTDRFLEGLRELVRYHDAPVFTITYYAQWLLMKAISEHGYRVSVSGTAADELFSGYYDHHLAYLYEVHKDPNLFAASKKAWATHIQPIVRNPFLSDPERFIRDPQFRDHVYLNADEFSEYFHQPWKEGFTEEFYCKDLLRNRMANELFHEAIPVILHEDDLNAMFYSIENRSPFLDRDLFEFCNSVPTPMLISDGYAKALLRKAVSGLAPSVALRNRRKVGFNAPIFDFLDRHDAKIRDELLRDSAIYQFVRRERIQSLLERNDLPNSESKFLFYFLSTKLFLEEFIS